jgi:alkylation response protein AidB-like acyl-CoA dehydrogenase
LIFVDDYQDIRDGVTALCAEFPGEYWQEFPGEYWQKLDSSSEYPDKFVAELTASGYLAALIPEEYGGSGLGVEVAGVILEEISRSGGQPGACHAQMYTMGTILRHGSPQQKARYLPEIAKGNLRLQAFGVTEPAAGTDTPARR